MLDLRAQYRAIKPEVDEAVMQVLTEQQFRGGPVVESFETDLAAFAGSRHAIGVASGTDALYLALRALSLHPGDEVITTPFSFFATAGAIVNAGGIPVFADIEPDTFNISPDRIEALITPKTKCILPVHIFGQCACMDAIAAIAEHHGLPIIEDAAQALGAQYQGRNAGSWGMATALSFYPTKNLGGAGEGGAILTNDVETAHHVRLLRSHGAEGAYQHIAFGVNSHLHTLQAAILHVKLRHLAAWNEARRERAAYYNRLLRDLPEITPPGETEESYHVYHQYVIRIPERDAAQRLLHEKGVGCSVFYPTPLHKQPCILSHLNTPAACPEAERACNEVLALPLYPELSAEQQDTVIESLAEHVHRLHHK